MSSARAGGGEDDGTLLEQQTLLLALARGGERPRRDSKVERWWLQELASGESWQQLARHDAGGDVASEGVAKMPLRSTKVAARARRPERAPRSCWWAQPVPTNGPGAHHFRARTQT